MKKNVYLERYSFFKEKLIGGIPHPELAIIVTIPTYNEPEIKTALKSLLNNTPPKGAVEAIVLINIPEDEDDTESLKQVSDLNKFIESHNTERFKIYILFQVLPKKDAGVGLARKILMDEAVRRFEEARNSNGIITGFDADCTCSSNYLIAIEEFFNQNKDINGCSIYFEHPKDGNFDKQEINAALEYELHLRCYIDALRWCGVPHAFQTIGSSMAVLQHAYQRQGGMNKRKAGEDFYFLHRIIKTGKFGDLTATKVIPSPRTSSRVPFGTGKAVIKRLETGSQYTYNPKSYVILRKLIEELPHFFKNKASIDNLPVLVNSFLKEQNADLHLSRIKNHSSNYSMFVKQFFQWMDGFMVMKFLHYCRENGLDDLPVDIAAYEIKNFLGERNNLTNTDPTELLDWFRAYDLKNPKFMEF